MNKGPLDGITVVDLSHFLAGPYAAAALAQMGADVIKVEDPDRPDEARSVGPGYLGSQTIYFLSLNWGKRSLCLRLASLAGGAALRKVIERADVVLDNFRPGVMKRLMLDHQALSEVNSRLITCSLSGYGETGPYASQPGYDYTIQALTGVMSLTGEPSGPPGKAGISYVDHAGGIAAALAITSALVERNRTGQGRHLDVSLLDVQMSMLSYLAAWELNTGIQTGRTASGAHPSLVPAQTFSVADGHISLFVGNDEIWARMVAALGVESLRNEQWETAAGRREGKEELLSELGSILRNSDSAHWVELLRSHHVPCAPVNSVRDALDDPQVAARKLIEQVRHPDYGPYQFVHGPVAPEPDIAILPAPLLGEHTSEILVASGLSNDDIKVLIEDGDAVQS